MNTSPLLSLAVLGSTRGTTLQYLIDSIESGKLKARITAVISNQANAYILERARRHGLTAHYLDSTGLSRAAYDQQLSEYIKQQAVDLILLIGYMRILSPAFVQQWSGKVLNVHPSLLPRHAGLLGQAVHQAVLDAGETESGCTIHQVVEQVDAGPIIVQQRCKLSTNETASSLKEKVQKLEGPAYVAAIQKLYPPIFRGHHE